MYTAHLRKLYDRRFNLFPSAVTVPIYISESDIPKRRAPFFAELKESVSTTMRTVYDALDEAELKECNNRQQTGITQGKSDNDGQMSIGNDTDGGHEEL
ncbi:MAG: hypothetical protein HFJ24_05835 [Clostridia bacterium]|nr:hypothetical protein [Clostridia bacterium]MCI9275473.1 hypothetical protein [Clostridia bacterium]